jgi:23S rRNA (adenine-N6)-dimethyltransferase
VSGRLGRRSTRAARSQHFLGRPDLAAELASSAHLGRDDLVVEPGAGFGRLTEQLAARAGRVIAVEKDARLAARLAGRLQHRPNVTVVQGDVLAVPLPHGRFRVVGNPPFHITAPLLERVLGAAQLDRADLVLEWGAALALTGVYGPAHKARRWAARYEFLLVRRLPAAWFEPAPACDAAIVSIRPLRRV